MGLAILIGLTSACAGGQGSGTELGGVVGTPTPGAAESRISVAPVRAEAAPAGDTRVESVAANPTSTNAPSGATAPVAIQDSERAEPEPAEAIAARTPEPEATVIPEATTAQPRPRDRRARPRRTRSTRLACR